jgi:hypothetical protein
MLSIHLFSLADDKEEKELLLFLMLLGIMGASFLA